MNERPATDLSHLPLHGLGTASLSWWGSLGYMLIEGTGFALVISMYFYLESLAPVWPMAAHAPGLAPGLVTTALFVVSLLPNHLLSSWAEAGDLRKVRIGVVVMTVLSILPLVSRVYEFRALNVSWDSNAYGSVVWLLLGLHTVHLLTDAIEELVLMGVMYSRHADNRRRYGDVQDNALYWYFVVVAWLPVFGCIYVVPRL